MSPFIRPSPVRHGDLLIARGVFITLLALFTATMVTQPDVLDGEVEFQTTSSLVRRNSFALGGTPEAEAIKSAVIGDRTGFNGSWGKPGREDEFFSWFGVGQAYVGFPFYILGAALGGAFPEFDERNSKSTHQGVERSEYFEHLMVLWRNSVLGALTAALIVLATRRLGASRTSAWIAGLAYGICTFAWPQARSTLNSVQTTFLLFLAFHQMLALEEALARYKRPKRLTLVLMGLALGGAFLTRPLTAPVLVVLAIVLGVIFWKGYRRPGRRMRLFDPLWALVPALACFALFLWTNAARFGDPFEQGYGDVVTLESYFNYPLHLGLAGILFSPGQGLLWMAPASFLGFVWAVRLLRRDDYRMPLVLLGVAVTVLVPVCMTVGWHGAHGYGPRYALPLLPFLWLGVAPSLDVAADSLPQRIAIFALLGLGLLTSLPGVLVDTTTHTDLAIQAARIEWPDEEWPGAEEIDEATRDEERFHRIRTDFRFAAPWAHWRILRHRLAGLDERFGVRDLFFVDRTDENGEQFFVEPAHERERGFRHLAWVDFTERLGGAAAIPILLVTALLALGLITTGQGLDPDQP